MVKILKEWIVPCTWNGWFCESCKNKTRTNRLCIDGLKFYVTSNGNGKNCWSSTMDTKPNVGEILSEVENLNHLYEEKYNNQGCLMRIVEDNGTSDIIVEFQDEYRYRKHTQYCNFKSGSIRNPYCPSIYGIGITGCKYPTKVNGVSTKEYNAWIDMLKRCFMEKTKDKQPSYKYVECCEEWLNFEAFCDWLREQPNYDKWKNGYRWAIDKDILFKRNKVYSPDTCTLVPQNVNCLFLKREAERGDYPIGVRYKEDDGFIASCHDPFTDKNEIIGYYSTSEKAFGAYKVYKEDIIKQVAEIEYKSGNITKECYQAMMKYEVEIDD